MNTVYFIVSGRPNYIKFIPVIQEMRTSFECHTIDLCQHKNKAMSGEILDDFGIAINHFIDLGQFEKNGVVDYYNRTPFGIGELLK